jgi:hypothetical protein
MLIQSIFLSLPWQLENPVIIFILHKSCVFTVAKIVINEDVSDVCNSFGLTDGFLRSPLL